MAGYGALGVAFESGHRLAFHRVARSSLGPPFSAVLHGHADGTWTLYVDIEPRRSWARYVGSALRRTVITSIDIRWSGDRVSVAAHAARLAWTLRLATGPAAALATGACALLPPAPSARTLRLLSGATGRLLRIAPPELHGVAPNGQRFATAPRRIWRVAGSAGVIDGHDAGISVAAGTAPLGGITVPGDGAFMVGETTFDAFDPDRHRTDLGRVARR